MRPSVLVVPMWMGLLLCGSDVVLAGQQASPATGSQASLPKFEVATVRLANRDDGRRWFGMKLRGGRLQVSAETLTGLVATAFGTSDEIQKVIVDASAPDWVKTENYDIEAKLDAEDMASWEQLSDKQRWDRVMLMLRQLLTERFHVKLTETSQMTPVYALVQAKGGAHVKEVAAPVAVTGDPDDAQAKWMTEHPGQVYPGMIRCQANECSGHAVKMDEAVGQIGACAHADRRVIDETGLTGYYDLSMPYPSGEDQFPMQTVADSLGVRFVSKSVPMKTYVIVSAEKPDLDGAAAR